MNRIIPIIVGLVGCSAQGSQFTRFLCIPVEAPSADYEPCATEREVDIRCVLDGDTVSLGRCGAEGERIRLLGINAPEIAHDGEDAECYGDEATDQLAGLIENETVWLSFGAECIDSYGRTLAWLWLLSDDDPILVSEWMLRHGHAGV